MRDPECCLLAFWVGSRQLADLGAQLESPFVKPAEAAKLGTEYERVQKEMDAKLGEWERMSQ